MTYEGDIGFIFFNTIAEEVDISDDYHDTSLSIIFNGVDNFGVN